MVSQTVDIVPPLSRELIRRGADKSLAFPIFLFAAQPKEFFLDGLKKLAQPGPDLDLMRP
jgi:hypothetical protein